MRGASGAINIEGCGGGGSSGAFESSSSSSSSSTPANPIRARNPPIGLSIDEVDDEAEDVGAGYTGNV